MVIKIKNQGVNKYKPPHWSQEDSVLLIDVDTADGNSISTSVSSMSAVTVGS